MNEEEKKVVEHLKKTSKDRTIIPLDDEILIAVNLIEKLQKENEELKSENRRLKVIRYSTEYGTENIHLITKRDLVEINTNKYFIEIQDGKFVDLKQVYQENEKLNKYKENYISVQKVKDKIEEEKAQYKTALEENSTEAFILKCQITILQELIEEREENNGKNI